MTVETVEAPPVEPETLVPYTLQWTPDRAPGAAVARFVHSALTAQLPPGWHASCRKHGAAQSEWEGKNRMLPLDHL